ncbi:hypothetical protein PsorP6_010382 [Peronosclerospora sorghi]|uniref:Uncharacterized protein n=1 Tax=Peronosclerospora sorghi TaxID=230839 RepID=A0ACC0VWL2_9STRA|nr:hypothetical protein PsorP6_010382 [Peronosclerospora sorghi]
MFMTHEPCEQLTEDGSWLIDSGASSHMSTYRDDFDTYQDIGWPTEVKVSDGNIVKAIGHGDVRMLFESGKVTVSNLLHIPGFDRRLL